MTRTSVERAPRFRAEILRKSLLPEVGPSLSSSPLNLVLCGGMKPLPKKPAESARSLSAGLTFAVTVALFAWGGMWLDERWDTKPWLVLVLTLTGVFGGGLHMVRELAPEVLGSWGKTRRSGAATPRRGNAGNETETPNSSVDD